MIILNQQKITIISHVYSPGPPHELEAFLAPKVKELFFIAHPLAFVKNRPSTYRYYRDGHLVWERTGRIWRLPDLVQYFFDAMANLYWGLRQPTVDLIIALDNLNAATAILLRGLGRTKKVVFYTIDYIPQRFAQPWLNRLYHSLDNLAVRQSDYVWNLSPVMIAMRRKKGIESEYTAKQLTVPIGTHILPDKKRKKDPNLVVFMGHLREGQGADLLLQAMEVVHRKNPTIKLRFIGGGPLEESLKTQAHTLGLDGVVDFKGFVPTNEAMRQLLLEGTIAVAPYVDDEKSFTRYTDPGKPKEYLAAGLPVIITRVPQFAETIEREGAGRAINYDRDELAAAIIELLSSKTLEKYQEQARTLASRYTWDKVFTQAFEEMEQ